jgi:hypothetical protein
VSGDEGGSRREPLWGNAIRRAESCRSHSGHTRHGDRRLLLPAVLLQHDDTLETSHSALHHLDKPVESDKPRVRGQTRMSIIQPSSHSISLHVILTASRQRTLIPGQSINVSHKRHIDHRNLRPHCLSLLIVPSRWIVVPTHSKGRAPAIPAWNCDARGCDGIMSPFRLQLTALLAVSIAATHFLIRSCKDGVEQALRLYPQNC